MGKLEQANDLYLRGFCSEYIKRRTGISTQQLLKQMRSRGVTYTKADVIKYQIAYIQSRYSVSEIVQEYERISKTYVNLDKAAHNKRIECLGCGFGQHAVVFRALLGDDAYKDLKNRCWHEKQKAVIADQYGVENIFQTLEPCMRSADVREKRRQTMLSRYGVEHPNQNEAIKARMMKTQTRTNLERYGTEFPMQCPEIAAKSAQQRQETMLQKYGAPNSVQIPEIRNRIFESRKRNGTLNCSQGEDVLYELLVAYFGKDDVFRNRCVDGRYPYHVDFYIESRDLFIELNGDKCHYTHWFDPNNEQDVQVLAAWNSNMIRLERDSGKPSRYRSYIKTWTVTDVAKRQAAKAASLNYLVFWDGSRKTYRSGQQFPRLSDAMDWFAAGCPDSKDWRSENTY